MSGTRTSLSGFLARTGFADVPRAERELAALGIAGADDPVLAALTQSADPDLALAGLSRVAARDPGLIGLLQGDAAFRARLTAVLGVSAALADHLARHPADAALLRGQDASRRPDAKAVREELLRAAGADPDAAEPVATPDNRPGNTPGNRPQNGPADSVDPVAQLTAAYHRRILHLAARDVTGDAGVDQVAEELADLADAVLEAALAIARAELPADAAPARLAVVAMGKCGARELNYASDIDVIFVAEPSGSNGDANEDAALKTAAKLAGCLIRVCERATAEGTLFPVDPNLRPQGRQGPLVLTLASHLGYYDRWAKTWEFQALLKARPAAGDMALGKRYAEAVAPLVWQASQRENFVEDVQAMRRRVVDTLPKNMAGRELKLGPGGLRDIEFAVQLLQLVHGRADDRLRVPATLPALAALAEGGYVGRADADDLAQAYRFLRRTEHLLQLCQLRRTHTLPTDPAVLRRLGRALGTTSNPIIPNVRLVPPVIPRGDDPPYPAVIPRGDDPPYPPMSAAVGPDRKKRDLIRPDRSGRSAARSRVTWGEDLPAGGSVPPEEAFTEAWMKTAQRVRRLHEKLFYRPLLDAVAKLPTGVARLTPGAAQARLEALGYRDPVGALRHIEALTSGLRRRAAIQRTLLPVLLGWFADAAEPDAGLLAFRQVSEALGESPWFLRLLRDETKAAERMAHVLASSRYATGLLLRAPEAVALFADDAELVPKPVDALRAEMMAAARRHDGAAEQAAVAVRSLRRRELLRVAAASVLGLIGLATTGEALTAINTATLDAVLAAAIAKIEMELRAPLPARFAVIAMGRYGGHESGFGSDADVIFVYDALPADSAPADSAPADSAPADSGPADSGPADSGPADSAPADSASGPADSGPADPDRPAAFPAASTETAVAERRAADAAHAVAAELSRLLTIPAPDPPLVVDVDLRPDGRQGPLVRSLAAYRSYYENRASPWEAQALLRAEFAVGDAGLGAQFTALADRYRYPPGGLSDVRVREIRRIKARVEAERIPRGTDRALHLKLGPGGLSDVEWTVQLLQLRYGAEVPGLRTTHTLAALGAAVDADLVPAADAAALRASWRLAARIRNAVMLVRGRPGDTLPAKHDELTAVARLLGYKPNGARSAPLGAAVGSSWADTPAAALEEDYRRTARRARLSMDRLFYG